MSVLVRLKDALLYSKPPIKYRALPDTIFKTPISLDIVKNSRVAVVGDGSKTTLLSILCGKYISSTTNARTYPSGTISSELLRFVNNGSWGHGAHDSSGGFTHLSSRYEFFKDFEIDEKVSDFISQNSYNTNIIQDNSKVKKLVEDLELNGLENNWITTLSNGQFRRARIAKELYRDVDLLCVDDPFLGLDPMSTKTVNGVLERTAKDSQHSTLVIGLRIQDEIPDWITNVIVVNNNSVVVDGRRNDPQVVQALAKMRTEFELKHSHITKHVSEVFNVKSGELIINENLPIIEMDNVSVEYRGVPAIKNLFWQVKEGEKWHIRGKNGSGKTTLLSLITLDHPQSWKRNIKVFGVARQPGKVNYFDTNKFIGFTSPELHALYPKKQTLREAISTGYIVGSYVPQWYQLSLDKKNKINEYLTMVGLDNVADSRFGDIPVSTQKLVLLLRAIINDPKILILDEALSAMTDEDVVKGKCIVNQWPGTCLIIGHVDEEIPKCDKYINVDQAREGQFKFGNP